MRRCIQKFINLVFCIFASLFFVSDLQAAELSVYPLRRSVEVDGGQTEMVDYTLQNLGTTPLTVQLELMSFVSDGQTGQPVISDKVDFPYLSLFDEDREVKSITLAPGQSKIVYVQVAPPLGIEVKEYPLVLLFSAIDPNGDPDLTSIGIQIGTNLIVYPQTGNADQSNLMVEFTDFPSFIDTFDKISPSILMHNLSPMATLVRGSAQLRAKDGTILRSWDLSEELVLGKSSRLMTVGSVSGGDNQEPTQLVFPGPLLGDYTLEVNYASGRDDVSGDLNKQAVYNFLVFPYRAVTVISLGALAVMFFWQWSQKRAQNAKKQQAYARRQSKMKAQREYFD